LSRSQTNNFFKLIQWYRFLFDNSNICTYPEKNLADPDDLDDTDDESHFQARWERDEQVCEMTLFLGVVSWTDYFTCTHFLIA
jgi:hypothetical protein